MAFSKTKLLAFFFAAFSLTTVGQENELTRSQYIDAISAAYDKGREFYPLRKTSTERTFNNKGRMLSRLEETQEWAASNIERKLSDETVNGKKSRIELIWIDSVYYCRLNGGQWKIERQNCSPQKSWGLTTVVSRTYSSQEIAVQGKKVRLLRSYSTGRDFDGGPLAYFLEETWIGENGMIVRQEMSRGIVRPKGVMWSLRENFSYGVKDVKIERPIP